MNEYFLVAAQLLQCIWVSHPIYVCIRQQHWRSVYLRPVYSDTTQLNSLVHSVNNCHRSVLNVVTQLTQFVGHDVIYDF